ncbi:MAG: SDR family NAD(P)-dependent oxidoreductase [Bryobacterales bacterium]
MPSPSRAVLITGCSSGIGKATALRLVKAGWPVYATARRPETLGELATAGCETLALDVTDEASMRAAVAHIEAEHGAVGALINNAGYSQSGALETLPMEAIRAQFETNVFGLLRLTQLVLPGMRRQRAGRIVLMGPMGGKLVFPGGGAYHATKYALEALADALRFEIEGFGIDVALIQPGLIRTGFADTIERKMPDAAAGPYAEFTAEVARISATAYESGKASKLAGDPDDVAQAVERALSAHKPKTRYPVTFGARLFMGMRRLLGDRGWDRFLSKNYPRLGD